MGKHTVSGFPSDKKIKELDVCPPLLGKCIFFSNKTKLVYVLLIKENIHLFFCTNVLLY